MSSDYFDFQGFSDPGNTNEVCSHRETDSSRRVKRQSGKTFLRQGKERYVGGKRVERGDITVPPQVNSSKTRQIL